MCIRDSAYSESLFLVIVLTSLLLAMNGNWLPAGVVAAFASVSYTHLRAHETVLDIVCRLLLEKKKNESIKNITDSLTLW